MFSKISIEFVKWLNCLKQFLQSVTTEKCQWTFIEHLLCAGIQKDFCFSPRQIKHNKGQRILEIWSHQQASHQII